MHWICIVSTTVYLVSVLFIWRARFVRVYDRELAAEWGRRKPELWGHNLDGAYAPDRRMITFNSFWWAVFWPFMGPLAALAAACDALERYVVRPTPGERKLWASVEAKNFEQAAVNSAEEFDLPMPRS